MSLKLKYSLIFLFIVILYSCKPYGFIGDDTVQMSQFQNIHFVHVTINGEEVKLLLDTGSSISILDISQSKRYQFGTSFLRTETYIGIGGSTDMFAVYGYKINEIFIPFMGTDLSEVCQHFRDQGINVVGILGSDFIERFKVIIDFENNVIYYKTYTK